MQAAKQEFAKRVGEINQYFTLLEKVENDFRLLSKNEEESYIINEELFKVLKANGFMLLYNLIESTVLNCIITIFDELREKGLSYDRISEKLRKYWLKYCYKHDDKIKSATVVNQLFLITENIINQLPIDIEIQKIDGAGSLDTIRIKKVADELGVELNLPRFNKNLHGETFQRIKKYRNDLAHGKSTFSDIGRDITYTGDKANGLKGLGLTHFKQYTIEHLEDFISDIETYLSEKRYLEVYAV